MVRLSILDAGGHVLMVELWQQVEVQLGQVPVGDQKLGTLSRSRGNGHVKRPSFHMHTKSFTALVRIKDLDYTLR